MCSRIDGKTATTTGRESQPAAAHHLVVEAICAHVLPTSWLTKLTESWEEPVQAEFLPRTAWPLLNAFTEIQKGSLPRLQMEGSLRLASLFRQELQLSQPSRRGRHRMDGLILHATIQPRAWSEQGH